ncbi:DNA starvation/stationary phase protection protein [Roseovarius aestuarii]|nr:DNA starvation/stationary phase protection protein [Roseovarius aestuarii]
MTDALKIVAEDAKVKTGIKNAKGISAGLADVLGDTYRLIFKTHACHWNVEGPLFFSIHKLTEGQYEEMFGAADELAERIRALGQMAPHRLKTLLKDSVITDLEDGCTAGDMCESLAKDHERVAHRLHALIELAEDSSDPVTADMATARSTFHEKAAWMLRAISKD